VIRNGIGWPWRDPAMAFNPEQPVRKVPDIGPAPGPRAVELHRPSDAAKIWMGVARDFYRRKIRARLARKQDTAL